MTRLKSDAAHGLAVDEEIQGSPDQFGVRKAQGRLGMYHPAYPRPLATGAWRLHHEGVNATVAHAMSLLSQPRRRHFSTSAAVRAVLIERLEAPAPGLVELSERALDISRQHRRQSLPTN
jgi:hypothetical protein